MWNALLQINLAITRYEQTIFVLLSHNQKCILYFSPFNFLVPALIHTYIHGFLRQKAANIQESRQKHTIKHKKEHNT